MTSGYSYKPRKVPHPGRVFGLHTVGIRPTDEENKAMLKRPQQAVIENKDVFEVLVNRGEKKGD